MRRCSGSRMWAAAAVCFFAGVAHAEWRVGFFTRLDEAGLRQGVMAELGRLAERFPQSATAAEAGKVVEADKNATDADAWVGSVLDFVDGALRANRPGKENAEIRKAILMILDYPLHVNHSHMMVEKNFDAKWAETIGKYYQKAIGPAIREIAETKVSDGLEVWKMYNMGFVVKSKNHCVGFDVQPGAVVEPYPLTAEQQASLVGQLEVLFISHVHGDHLQLGFVQRMLDAGKKVVLPTEIRKDIQHKNAVRLYDDWKTATDLGGVKVLSFPGRQDRKTVANVYAVNLDGFWVSHNGDNCVTEIYAEIPKQCAIDVLLANCWSGIKPYALATKPRLMITGHENEMGHHVGHRRPFVETLDTLSRIKEAPEWVLLQWGERISYKR